MSIYFTKNKKNIVY